MIKNKDFILTTIILILLNSIIISISNINNIFAVESNISPNCGPVSGFDMTLNVDGFQPNSNVHWDFIWLEDESIQLSGYFKTNSTGGFSESTYADDLTPGKYKVHFFNDNDFDNSPDIDDKIESFAEFSLPCE